MHITFSISAIPNGNSMASDNLSVDPMAMFANMNDDPFQTDINNSEEVPDNSEEGPKKSTLKKVDSFVSYTEPGPIVRHSSVSVTWYCRYKFQGTPGKPWEILGHIGNSRELQGTTRKFRDIQ